VHLAAAESATGKLYLNEIGTIPGFTSISTFPWMWEQSGLPFSALLDRLIDRRPSARSPQGHPPHPLEVSCTADSVAHALSDPAGTHADACFRLRLAAMWDRPSACASPDPLFVILGRLPATENQTPNGNRYQSA
jgi:hypothetical protein